MDRQAHLKAARNLAARAATLHTEGEYLGAGELIWGATVHAVSAADPEHEAQPPDRHGNPHQAPNTSVTFTLAARRISWKSFHGTGHRPMPGQRPTRVAQPFLSPDKFRTKLATQHIRWRSLHSAAAPQRRAVLAAHNPANRIDGAKFNSECRMRYRRRGQIPRRRSAF